MHEGLNPGAVSTVLIPTSTWWRVFHRSHGPLGFNGTEQGNSRFSPLRDSEGTIIPTLYCGSSTKVALMESVLHDVPSPSDRFIYFSPSHSEEEREIAGIQNAKTLLLADFSTVGLRRLGLTRGQVVDSGKPDYPATRMLAQWLYLNRPDVQGIRWTSRQLDLGQVIVLFEPRLAPDTISVQLPGESIALERWQDEILELVIALGGGLKQG